MLKQVYEQKHNWSVNKRNVTCQVASDQSIALALPPQSCRHRFLQCIFLTEQIQEHYNQMSQPSVLKPVNENHTILGQSECNKRYVNKKF